MMVPVFIEGKMGGKFIPFSYLKFHCKKSGRFSGFGWNWKFPAASQVGISISQQKTDC